MSVCYNIEQSITRILMVVEDSLLTRDVSWQEVLNVIRVMPGLRARDAELCGKSSFVEEVCSLECPRARLHVRVCEWALLTSWRRGR